MYAYTNKQNQLTMTVGTVLAPIKSNVKITESKLFRFLVLRSSTSRAMETPMHLFGNTFDNACFSYS